MAQIQFENGVTVDFDGDPTPEDIEEVVNSLKLNKPTTLSGKASNILQNIPRPPVLPSELTQESALGVLSPIQSQFGQQLESSGQRVKDVARTSVSDFVSSPTLSQYPTTKAVLGTAASTLTDIAPFTPSEMAISIGSEALVPFTTAGVSAKLAKISDRIVNSYLGTDAKLLKKELGYKAEKFSEKFLKAKELKGSREEVASLADEAVTNFEEAIQNKIKAASTEKTKNISKKEILKLFDKLKEKMNVTGLEQNEINQVNKMFNSFKSKHPESGSPDYWNTVKRRIYQLVGDKKYLAETPTAKVEVQMAIAKKIKESIENVIPEIKQLNSRQGFYLQVRNSLNNLMSKKGKDIFGSVLGSEKERAALMIARSKIPRSRGVSGIVAPFSMGNNINLKSIQWLQKRNAPITDANIQAVIDEGKVK